MNNWGPQELKALRKAHKLSRRAFGELLGVTGNYVYLLEKGVKSPSKTLRLLLDFVKKQLAETEKGGKKHGKTQRHL